MRNVIIAGGLLASLMAAGTASAQTYSASGQANVGGSLPGAAAGAVAGPSDHDLMVGRLAVGYFGIAQMGAGANGAPGANDSPYAIIGNAPVVGVRYWVNPMLGIDAGLGLSVVGGSIDPGGDAPKIDRGSFSAFLIHAGLPLALASAGHFTFEVIPEVNLGFGHAGVDMNGSDPGDVSNSGFHFDLGARAGAEINFGFMKLPQLSLVGTVGLRFDSDKGSTTDDEGMAPVKVSSSRSEFHTLVGSNPWAIFTDNIAALYYF